MVSEGPEAGDDRRPRRDDDTEQFPRQPGPEEGDDPERYVGTAEGGTYYEESGPSEHFTEEEFAALYGDQGGASPSLPVGGTRRILPLEDEPSSIVARYLFPTEK